MELSNPEAKYLLALVMTPGLGPARGRAILDHFGTAREWFSQKGNPLLAIPGLSTEQKQNYDPSSLLDTAERELEFMHQEKVRMCSIKEARYPALLAESHDPPLLLFRKGLALPPDSPMLSVVGTRRATSYGRDMCRSLIEGLAQKFPDLCIVSGLAYGIDAMAHRAALKAGLPTLAVLGHGLNTLYPGSHRDLSKLIMEQGALVSDFPSQIAPEARNFHRRNRIIAGLSKATLVVESAAKGGSLITAKHASNYSRDLLAVPGRAGDRHSAGCNFLIREQYAALVETPEDILRQLNWQENMVSKGSGNLKLFPTDRESKQIIEALKISSPQNPDQLSQSCRMDIGLVMSILLRLEMEDLVRKDPGNRYHPTMFLSSV